MKNRFLSIVAALTVTTVFTGCQSSGGAYLPKNATKYNYEDSEQLVLMDSMVQRSVTSPGIQQTRLPDGRLEVAANLRNREGRRIQVQTQCEFKDGQGFTIDSTPWVTTILTERGQETVRFTSMNDKAQRYTIRVRQAH
jgi:predicted small lipoprotein YifL